MINYETWCRIQALHKEKGLTASQIAGELKFHRDTVSRWIAQTTWQTRKPGKRPSKLDPYKGQIARLIERHPYSAVQLLARVREQGYEGAYSILKAFVAQVRPPRQKAFLSLHFDPGKCAQVDWGHASISDDRQPQERGARPSVRAKQLDPHRLP
ncbi:MAG: transposase [Kiritimatiellia bacterium]|jgi:transposase